MTSVQPASRYVGRHKKGDTALAARLKKALKGDVMFDAFTRGRYSTDASVYQIEPVGVVVPQDIPDVETTIEIAAEAGVPILPRGGGTSQCGQTVGEAIILDLSKHVNKVLEFDPGARTVWVEPGLVLDHLNAYLKPHGLWFPVDVSTSSRATIGGMTGNNSCGSRSIVYGTMRDNVRAIDGLLADGGAMRFGEVPGGEPVAELSGDQRALVEKLLGLGRREANHIRETFPDVMRRVGGYNVDALMPGGAPRGDWAKATVNRPRPHPNLAHLLVGSEGTLAFSKRIQLDLQPIHTRKVLGVCHFPAFHQCMDATQHLVKLGPAAVELVDRTMIELSRDIPVFRAAVDKFVKGEPEALLLVEFAGEDLDEQKDKLKRLADLMAELGFPGGVVEAVDPAFQKAIWEVRKSGLNIMMSMKGDGKPISFIEDCAVRLEDLADFTGRLTQIFRKHGANGTWYAHASVGTLHVRPVVNLKEEAGAKRMRAIAEEAFEIVREYKGSHSGEHGDGLVRSEFHEAMFGGRMVRNFKEVKEAFDPKGVMNPGKIVEPTAMDDRSLFRFKPGYRTDAPETGFDWSEWNGLAGAVEMCNNNGACRKRDAGVMCPSYRVTGDEQHVVRGRANTLRLALSGQLGAGAFTSEEMREAMKLCVGCKGCKRECPTGVDMTKMKTEFLYQYNKKNGLRLFDRLVAYLPRYAPAASRLGGLLNLRDAIPGMAKLSEAAAGFHAGRPLPKWAAKPFEAPSGACGPAPGPPGRAAVLFSDTFNRYFEPENMEAAVKVLSAADYRIIHASPHARGRPLCCGRTFLAAGLIDEAREEASRFIEAVLPHAAAGLPIIGLEPSCLFSLKDEFPRLLPGGGAKTIANRAVLFEEFIAHEIDAGKLRLGLKPLRWKKALLHGHCHQKAFAAMGAVEKALSLVPELDVETIDGGCCGMAGAFGYQGETADISMRMGELSLLPAVRGAGRDTLIIADGTSCRHQIEDGAKRRAKHAARVLADALA